MKNTLYCCCVANPWLDVIKDLEKEGLKAKYYIGWENEISDIKNSGISKDIFIQSVEDLWNGKGFPKDIDYEKYGVNNELLDRFAKEQVLALKMMDRLDPTRHNFALLDRQNYFYRLLRYWLGVIDTYQIDFIIFSVIPHRVFDFALYIVAKYKDITTIMFQMTPFEGYAYVLDDIYSIPNYIKESEGSRNTEYYEKIEEKLSRIYNESYDKVEPKYMKDIGSIRKTSLIDRLNSFLANRVLKLLSPINSYHIEYEKTPESSNVLYIYYLYLKIRRVLFLKKLQQEYEAVCDNKLPKKYIFFALHYQPEETTNPSGEWWENQYFTLMNLLKLFPKEYKIVVKEHKAQFDTEQEGATGRTISYYKQMIELSLDRVQFVSTNTDPFILIENALATVTITGTIGWESAVRGTPSIIFGRSWYEGMEGVFRVYDSNELQKIIYKLLDGYTISYEKIKSFHKNLSRYLFEAHFYKGFGEEVSNKRSVDEIVRAIKEYMNGY